MARYGEQRFWDLSPSALTFGINSPVSKSDFKRTPQSLLNRQPVSSNMWLVIHDEIKGELGKLKIQTVPLSIDVGGESSWDIIPSIGRNNPFYHYTGSEDSLTFILDWYSNENLRQDVIRNCRWVRSLSKANGYKKEPPVIVLIFGNLFTDEQWIVESAPYKLELFDKEMNMLPRQAYQTITLKRISDHNLTTDELRYVDTTPPLLNPQPAPHGLGSSLA